MEFSVGPALAEIENLILRHVHLRHPCSCSLKVIGCRDILGAADAHSHRANRPLFAYTSGTSVGAVEREADEFSTRTDAELLEDAAQVVVDCSGTDKQLGGDLAVRTALTDGAHHLQLLTSE